MTVANGSTGTNGNGTAVARNPRGQFLRGHRSLGGRKPGSRNKLSEQFLNDLHSEWRRSGKKVLQRVAETAPETFLRCVSQILPRVMEIDGVLNVTHRSELAIEVADFNEAYQRWGKFIGANMPLIEAEAVEDDDSIEADDEQSSNGR